jgi:dynein light chain LC8-type
MQTDAIEIAQEAIGSFMLEKDMANFIKKEFDKKYTPTWHVIIGKSWGSFVTHATK